jgi:hypothetical protein
MTIVDPGTGRSCWLVSWIENGERRYPHGYPTQDLAEKEASRDRAAARAGKGGLAKARPGRPELFARKDLERADLELGG